MIYQRTELLIGRENLEKLKKSHVAIFGLGGVGGYAVEALARIGVGELTIVDFDKIDVTNINRQIIATTETVGKFKADVMEQRIKSINSDIKVHAYREKFTRENADKFFENRYDYIIDAIDLITPKLDLVERALKENLKIISSMGTGNKIDPTRFEITDIKKTSVCPLARVFRKELKARGIKKLTVVYSKEEPKKPLNVDGSRAKSVNLGSVSFVPPAVGLILASHVVKEICNL